VAADALVQTTHSLRVGCCGLVTRAHRPSQARAAQLDGVHHSASHRILCLD
jgi:hypothetical protein